MTTTAITIIMATSSALVNALSSSRILSADWLRPVLLPTTLTTCSEYDHLGREHDLVANGDDGKVDLRASNTDILQARLFPRDKDLSQTGAHVHSLSSLQRDHDQIIVGDHDSTMMMIRL